MIANSTGNPWSTSSDKLKTNEAADAYMWFVPGKKQIWFVYLPESSTQTRRQGQMQARVTTWANTYNSTCWQIIHSRFYSQIHCQPWKPNWVTCLWGKGNLPLICIYHWLSIGYHPTVASRGMNLQMNLMSEQNSQKIQSLFINRVHWTILPECQNEKMTTTISAWFIQH